MLENTPILKLKQTKGKIILMWMIEEQAIKYLISKNRIIIKEKKNNLKIEMLKKREKLLIEVFKKNSENL